MRYLISMIQILAPVVLPFVFVFSLINAQKYLMEQDLKFVWCGGLAAVSIILFFYGIPLLPQVL